METLYKLNDRIIKNAKPKEKDYRLSDGGGLYLVVKASGGKLWRWSYEFNGKEKLLSYGPYPFVTLANARELHAAARALKSNGTDPAAEKQAKKHAEEEREKASSMPTFAELTKECAPSRVRRREPAAAGSGPSYIYGCDVLVKPAGSVPAHTYPLQMRVEDSMELRRRRIAIHSGARSQAECAVRARSGLYI